MTVIRSLHTQGHALQLGTSWPSWHGQWPPCDRQQPSRSSGSAAGTVGLMRLLRSKATKQFDLPPCISLLSLQWRSPRSQNKLLFWFPFGCSLYTQVQHLPFSPSYLCRSPGGTCCSQQALPTPGAQLCLDNTTNLFLYFIYSSVSSSGLEFQFQCFNFNIDNFSLILLLQRTEVKICGMCQ